MNTAEHLAQLSNALHLLAADYPAWAGRPMADGYPTRTPGHGMPTGHGKGNISDPTLDAATARLASTSDEGGDLWTQAHQAATHAYGHAMRLWRHAQGCDAPPIPIPATASIGLVCQIAGDALENAGRPELVGSLKRATIAGVSIRDVLDAIRADTVTIRAIIPARRVDATWAKEELCANPAYTLGPRKGQRPHDHDTKPVPAVTRCGHCVACYERVRRNEQKESAA